VPAATPRSAGQAAALPVQLSATSQPPPLFARHTVVDGRNTSAGQAAALPVQVSAVSQTPAEARHTVPAAESASVGHTALEPVQVSAGSHAPTDARHTVLDGTNAFAGHAEPVPLQVSATSQPPAAAARHTVPAATLPQAVGPDTVVVGATQAWQLFAGFRSPLLKQTPPMRQKPSSTRPSQSLSIPSQNSAGNEPDGAAQPGIPQVQREIDRV